MLSAPSTLSSSMVSSKGQHWCWPPFRTRSMHPKLCLGPLMDTHSRTYTVLCLGHVRNTWHLAAEQRLQRRVRAFLPLHPSGQESFGWPSFLHLGWKLQKGHPRYADLEFTASHSGVLSPSPVHSRFFLPNFALKVSGIFSRISHVHMPACFSTGSPYRCFTWDVGRASYKLTCNPSSCS